MQYNKAINEAIEDTLDKEINLYGESTADILEQDQQLFDSKQKTLGQFVNETEKALNSIDYGKAISSFEDFGSESLKVGNMMLMGAGTIAQMINPAKSTFESLAQLESERLKKQESFNQRRLEIDREYGDLAVNGTENQKAKLQLLLKQLNKEELNSQREFENKKTNIILKGITDTFNFVKSYTGVISSFYTTVLNGLSTVASKGAEAFSALNWVYF